MREGGVCAGSDRVIARGRTKDLKGAEVATTGALNDTPTTEVLLREGFKEHRFGAGGPPPYPPAASENPCRC